jgi:IS30 family transposase
MPGKPFQSKLLPHLAFVRERRARRWSYVRIAAALRQEHGLSVAPSTIFSFVKVRARRPRAVHTLPEEAAVSHATAGEGTASAARSSANIPRLPANAASFFTPEPSSTPSTPPYEQKTRPYRLDF